MSYAPLIHPGEIASQANPFARSPVINSLLNRCYGSDILPNRSQFPRSFSGRRRLRQPLPFPEAVGRRRSILVRPMRRTGTSSISTSSSGAATYSIR